MLDHPYRQFQAALAEVGIAPLSRDTAALVLAVTGLFNIEGAVFDGLINSDIQAAQQMANLLGGEVPDPDMARRVRAWLHAIQNDPAAREEAYRRVKARYGLDLNDHMMMRMPVTSPEAKP